MIVLKKKAPCKLLQQQTRSFLWSWIHYSNQLDQFYCSVSFLECQFGISNKLNICCRKLGRKDGVI